MQQALSLSPIQYAWMDSFDEIGRCSSPATAHRAHNKGQHFTSSHGLVSGVNKDMRIPSLPRQVAEKLVDLLATSYNKIADKDRRLKHAITANGSPRPYSTHSISCKSSDMASTDHNSTNFSLEGFLEMASTLPAEICKMVMDDLFESIFGPKMVHPQTDSSILQNFLALDKQLYYKYSKIYWSENTWVIGHGPADETMRFMTLAPYSNSIMEFSKQKPNEAAMNIKRVELSLSKKDLSRPQTVRVDEIKATRSLTDSELPQSYKTDHKSFASTLLQIWQDKFDRIAFLDLEHLTLDFTEAYAPDGAFLGVAAVRRFMRFFYRIPGHFKVVAATKELEVELRRIFEELNEPESVGARSTSGESA